MGRLVALAVVMLLVVVTASPADYVFIQYTMTFKKAGKDDGKGGPPGQPMPQPVAPGQAQANDADVVKVPVHGCIEVTKLDQAVNPFTGRQRISVKHKWGKTALYNDEDLGVRALPFPSPKMRYRVEHDRMTKNRTPQAVYNLADFCLSHAMVSEFAQLMDEVAGAGKKTGLDEFDRAAEAYVQVKAALAQKIDRDDASNYWRGRLGFRMSQSEHYTLLYNAALNNPPEVERRLKLLEENMKAIYYWFAFKGVVLNMPDQKLVAVLLDQPDQFVIQRQLIEDEPLVTDGFFAARDNVVVFSAQRIDGPSVQFNKRMQGYWQQGWDREALLKGDKPSRLAGKSADEYEQISTLALLHKAMEEESERAAVSHEGTRQIMVGCGLQKSTVVMPDWVQFGVASVFETTKGPFPLAPPELNVAWWPGYAAPSWKWTRIFKMFEGDGIKP
jgi:hypothetical protein